MPGPAIFLIPVVLPILAADVLEEADPRRIKLDEFVKPYKLIARRRNKERRRTI